MATIDAKLDRAEELTQRLVAEFENFVDSQPYAMRAEDDPKMATKNLVVWVSKAPEESWSVIVGEICHDLRSALDQLVWTLSETPSEWSGFPIYCSEALYTASGRQGGAIRLQGVPDRIRRGIDRVQPFRAGGSASPFWLLHELNRVDKHRAPVLALAELRLIQVHLKEPRDEIRVLDPPQIVHSGIAEVGTEIARYRIVGSEPGSDEIQAIGGKVEFLFSAQTVFKDAGPASDLPADATLLQMCRLTRRVVTHLRCFSS
jgi:hypothetical protein